MLILKRKDEKNQSGQALIELIIFLPLMFILYSLISGFANAINGSINQQKITRGFYFYRLNNNSTMPKPDGRDVHQGWRTFGMYLFGWAESLPDDVPVLTCYRISIPLAGNNQDEDTCEARPKNGNSQFIRVGTVFGLCGATYVSAGNLATPLPDVAGATFQQVVDVQSCLLTQ